MGQGGEDGPRIRLIMDLRLAGITDLRVLGAIERVPRDEFVPPAFRERAWDNVALPIGNGQTISQPYVVAFMTQALEVTDRHKVLEIGTGSGYQAAILAGLCRRLYTIERVKPLRLEAERRFAALGLQNVVTKWGDGTKGWPDQGTFDRIMVTAASPSVPPALLQQLGPGGVLVAPIGPLDGDQDIVRIRHTETGFVQETLLKVRFVPLVAGPAHEG
jgi:protein-L-isoaspartate(D-aspartate) O-methyltransferase